MKPKLERWIQYHGCLVGYIFDHPHFSPGERVATEVVVYIDPINFEARCRDGEYKLGEPGTADEHNQELLKPIQPKIHVVG